MCERAPHEIEGCELDLDTRCVNGKFACYIALRVVVSTCSASATRCFKRHFSTLLLFRSNAS